MGSCGAGLVVRGVGRGGSPFSRGCTARKLAALCFMRTLPGSYSQLNTGRVPDKMCSSKSYLGMESWDLSLGLVFWERIYMACQGPHLHSEEEREEI